MTKQDEKILSAVRFRQYKIMDLIEATKALKETISKKMGVENYDEELEQLTTLQLELDDLSSFEKQRVKTFNDANKKSQITRAKNLAVKKEKQRKEDSTKKYVCKSKTCSTSVQSNHQYCLHCFRTLQKEERARKKAILDEYKKNGGSLTRKVRKRRDIIDYGYQGGAPGTGKKR